jgi:hypothetical protein
VTRDSNAYTNRAERVPGNEHENAASSGQGEMMNETISSATIIRCQQCNGLTNAADDQAWKNMAAKVIPWRKCVEGEASDEDGIVIWRSAGSGAIHAEDIGVSYQFCSGDLVWCPNNDVAATLPDPDSL